MKKMEKFSVGVNAKETLEFEGEQIASSDWKIEALDLTGFVRVYLAKDGRLVTYSEQREVDDATGTSVEKKFHITLIKELLAVKNRSYLGKLFFGDELFAIRNELRLGMPIEMESNDIIKLLAMEIAKRL